MRLVLPGAEGHRRNTVADHPVSVEPAIRGADGRRSADGGHCLYRAFDHGQAFLHAEWIVVGLGLELDTAWLALTVLNALRSLLERCSVGFGDLLEKLRVVASAFAAHVNIVGDDIGGISGRPAIAAGDRADIARALPLALDHLAEPATGLHVGKRKRKDHGRTDPALWCHACVRGAAKNLDLPAIRADGADADIGGRTAVVVEGHDR